MTWTTYPSSWRWILPTVGPGVGRLASSSLALSSSPFSATPRTTVWGGGHHSLASCGGSQRPNSAHWASRWSSGRNPLRTTHPTPFTSTSWSLWRSMLMFGSPWLSAYKTTHSARSTTLETFLRIILPHYPGWDTLAGHTRPPLVVSHDFFKFYSLFLPFNSNSSRTTYPACPTTQPISSPGLRAQNRGHPLWPLVQRIFTHANLTKCRAFCCVRCAIASWATGPRPCPAQE